MSPLTRACEKFTRRLNLEPLEDRRMLSTCHVTRLGDTGNGFGFRGDLRYCINKVNDLPGPDKIVFQPTAYGTINLVSELPVLESDVEIQGPGAELLTIRRNTGGDYRIFYIADDTVTISGVTIANGRSDKGGGIFNQGTLYLNSVVVSSNASSGGFGGGVYNNGFLAMTDTSILANSVSHSNAAIGAYGGGLYNLFGTVKVLSSTIANNQAKQETGYGGGIYNLGSMTIEYSAVSENTVLTSVCDEMCTEIGFGGGIANHGTLTISSSTVAGNRVLTGAYGAVVGGGIATTGTTTITNSTVVSNSARSVSSDSFVWGGGIFLDEDGSLLLEGSTISANSVDQPGDFAGGGGVHAVYGNATLRNSIVAKNSSGATCPDISGPVVSSGYNLIGDSACSDGYIPTDILNVDPLLAPPADNGGPTLTMALLPGSPAIDSGDNTDAPEWDQRGPGFPRIVNGTIDIGAFEVQATGAPALTHDLAVLATADFRDPKLKVRRSC